MTMSYISCTFVLLNYCIFVWLKVIYIIFYLHISNDVYLHYEVHFKVHSRPSCTQLPLTLALLTVIVDPYQPDLTSNKFYSLLDIFNLSIFLVFALVQPWQLLQPDSLHYYCQRERSWSIKGRDRGGIDVHNRYTSFWSKVEVQW